MENYKFFNTSHWITKCLLSKPIATRQMQKKGQGTKARTDVQKEEKMRRKCEAKRKDKETSRGVSERSRKRSGAFHEGF